MDFKNGLIGIFITLAFLIWCREPEIKAEEIILPNKKQEIFKKEYKKMEKQYKEVKYEVTAYCPCEKCCGKWADGKTANGNDAYLPGVAVDKNKISLGTVIEIPGYGMVKADDVGGAIKGNRLDIRFKTHQEALNWGRQKLKVKIYYGN